VKLWSELKKINWNPGVISLHPDEVADCWTQDQFIHGFYFGEGVDARAERMLFHLFGACICSYFDIYRFLGCVSRGNKAYIKYYDMICIVVKQKNN